MNTPNKLTVLRILLVPFFVAFLLIKQIPYNYLWATLIFAIASITDTIDGKMARKYNLVTDFGKFMDPLADKILVTSALVCFIELGFVNSIMVVIILASEFMVTSLRLIASGKGKVIAASMWGKVKTVSQMVGIVVILLLQTVYQFTPFASMDLIVMIGQILMWIATLLTLISGAEYMISNRGFLNDKSQRWYNSSLPGKQYL